MKTEALYLSDSYLKELESEIIEIANENNELRVMLAKTIFYPMVGGQPTDQGVLELENRTQLEVYQVMLKDGEIWHYIKNPQVELKVGDKVIGKINWERRYKNMKLHSAGHIIDFALFVLGYSPKTLSPLKGDHGKKPYIVYNGEVDHDIKSELEAKAIELVEKRLNFSWEFLPLEELTTKAIYLQPGLPSNKPLRALTLEGIGTVADGGTQVKNSSEVGKIAITKIEVINGTTIINYSLAENSMDNSTDTQNTAGANENSNQAATNPVTQPAEISNVDLTKYGVNSQEIKDRVAQEISASTSDDQLTLVWRKYLGREGEITLAFKKIGIVEAQDRKSFGEKLNELKTEVDSLISNAQMRLKEGKNSEYLNQPQAELDFKKAKIGHIHPLTETTNTLNEIFMRLGYSVMDGPEIETDEYCFQRLNVPMDHPARDLQDSIYIEEPNILLRTQTSSIEARVLETYKPPFKVVMPGRVYRNEKVNKSNHFTFHQYQLVCVQEKVSLAELFATINHLFKTYLGEDVVTRFRNKYYPEVEPGVGPDMQCFNCHGTGKIGIERCGVCKGRGWMEMGGAGIIHPNVLKLAGLDPQKWQGYAFGLGLDRWAMAKHKITDIRTLLDGNLAYQPNN